MNTKQILGLGALIILVAIVGMVAVYNIPVSFAARQPETVSPISMPFSTNTVQPAAAAIENQILETVSAVPAVTGQIPFCSFGSTALASSPEFSLDSFRFSDPEIVLTSKTSIRLYQWLPDNQSWLIGRHISGSPKEYLETINLNTNEIKRYAEWYGSEKGAIWLPSQNAVAFVDFILPDSKRVLRLSQGEDLPFEELATDLGTSLLSLSSDGQEIIFSSASQGIQSLDLKKLHVPESLINGLPNQSNSNWYYMDSWSPDGMMAVMYQRGGFYLVNQKTQFVCEVDLGLLDNKKAWAYDVKWSSDGRYIAMLVTVGELPLRLMKLRILDTFTGEVRDINSEWRNVNNMDWMPRGNVLLITVDANQDPLMASFKNLYLVDAATGNLKPIFPEQSFFAISYYGILWSPDGSRIGLSCADATPPDEVTEWRFCTANMEIEQ